MTPYTPSREEIAAMVAHALEEDLGGGDVTADLIAAETTAIARVISRQAAVICGRDWFAQTFHHLDLGVTIDWMIEEGQQVTADTLLCTLHGPARALLSGERTALNFLQTLSGTATRTRRFVETVAGTGTRILDTRKTLPGLRRAQKYAVRCGGGHNHRMGLYDAILIKENHIMAAGSINAAVETARRLHPDIPVEVEVENLDELREALSAGTDRVLLDNMLPETLREAVTINSNRAELEASGGISIASLRAIAETGVDYISIGALTKDVEAVDLSMRFQFEE